MLAAPLLVAADAVSFVASALLVGRIRTVEHPPPRAHRRPLRVEIAEGLVFVGRSPLLRRIVACTSVVNLASGVSNAVLVLLAQWRC